MKRDFGWCTNGSQQHAFGGKFHGYLIVRNVGLIFMLFISSSRCRSLSAGGTPRNSVDIERPTHLRRPELHRFFFQSKRNLWSIWNCCRTVRFPSSDIDHNTFIRVDSWNNQNNRSDVETAQCKQSIRGWDYERLLRNLHFCKISNINRSEKNLLLTCSYFALWVGDSLTSISSFSIHLSEASGLLSIGFMILLYIISSAHFMWYQKKDSLFSSKF